MDRCERGRAGPVNLSRIFVAIVAGLVGAATLPAAGTASRQAAVAITCDNPYSGARWQVTIDYQKSTVDSYPADITRSAISWFDPRDGGYNSIDRASGELVTALGSSTGGWLRHNHCSLDPSR
jgi:hypothetical protein